ncbi:MAG TPA: peptidase domain-containing ABC transporter [Geminicoccaceae bacterium]|nr:peptidase domain-containing ABC transporter [Geminicoccaceae bacterium]
MVAVSASAPEVPAAPARDTPQDALLLGLLRLARQQGRPLSEAELRAAAPVPESGADLRSLLRVAERTGFRARVERVSARRLQRLATPFLLIGRAVGEAWHVPERRDGRLVLVDPLTGEAVDVAPATAATWASAAVRIRPESGTPSTQSLRRALTARLRRPLWEIGLASVTINLLALATPVFMMTVYNKVINHGALQTLDVLAIGMVSLMLFELVLRGIRGFLASHAGARLDAALGSEVVHHLVQLPYRTFERMPSGQLMERLRQLDQLRQFLTGHLPLLLVDLAFVGLFVAALFVLSPALASITAAAMPLFVLVSVLAQRRQTGLQQEGSRAAAAKASCLNETVSHALTVKALGLEPELERRFERRLVEAAVAGFRASSLGNLVGSIGQALQHLTALVLVYVGAKLIVAGDLTVGALVASSILAARALAPMRQIFGAWHQLQQARDAFRRLDSLLAEPAAAGPATGEAAGATAAVQKPGKATIEVKGRIRLEQVSFRYTTDRPPALARVSLDVAPGTMLGIAGTPGSGKSTLVKLLLGLEQPESGRLLIDEVDLRLLEPALYRSQIGFVPQEVQLFSGTVAENIAMGAADRSFARIIAAAKFVGLHDFVQRLPDGYETLLAERGSGLSLGQRQLIAIARAIVRNPRILVLDEATSALDPGTEAHLLQSLRRAGRGRTILVVSHRPAVLRTCDQALLLHEGRVLAVGSPAEILSRTAVRPAPEAPAAAPPEAAAAAPPGALHAVG